MASVSPDRAESVNPLFGEFVETAKRELGEDLSSIVLFGSAADGTMRASSDVNLILVLARFERSKVDRGVVLDADGGVVAV